MLREKLKSVLFIEEDWVFNGIIYLFLFIIFPFFVFGHLVFITHYPYFSPSQLAVIYILLQFFSLPIFLQAYKGEDYNQNGVATVRYIILNSLLFCASSSIFAISHYILGRRSMLFGTILIVHSVLSTLFFINLLIVWYRVLIDFYKTLSPHKERTAQDTLLFHHYGIQKNEYLHMAIILYLIFIIILVMTSSFGGLVKLSLHLLSFVSLGIIVNPSSLISSSSAVIVILVAGLQVIYSNILSYLSESISVRFLIYLSILSIIFTLIATCITEIEPLEFSLQYICQYNTPVGININTSGVKSRSFCPYLGN